MRNLVKTCGIVLGLGALGLALACGGGGGGSSAPAPQAPPRLHYTDPAGGGWRLVADPASNDTGTLNLRVMGPSGQSVQGFTVFLRCEGGRAQWAQPAGATDAYVKEGGVLNLGGGDASVKLFRSRLGGGKDLQVALYQKQGGTAVGSEPLATLSLRLAAGATAGPVALVATPGKRAVYVDANGEHELSLAVGTLSVQ